MHEALDRLYKERPGGDPLPRPGSLAAWIARGREIVAAVVAERELGSHPAERAMARRVERLLERFLAEEAERDTGGFEPWLLEAGFGAREEDSERPALELDGWGLHGAIDRVDRAADGRAVVLDYKLSGAVTPREKFEEQAKLQLPLYLLAVAEHWGAEPVGGLYHPLRGTSVRRPRGVVLEEAAGGPRLATASTTATSSTSEGFERAAGGLATARRRDRRPHARRRHPPRPRPAPGPARPRRLPHLLQLRADLPPRPRPRVRGGRRGGGAMSERAPTPEQAAAIEVSGRDVLLEAGAGTGKTGVMVDRYCRLVCDKGVSPDAILAFTFTDKAAAELRQRIRAELARRAEAGSERARELLGDDRRRLGDDDPRLLQPAARRRTRSRPGSTPASASSTPPRRPAPPARPSTRRCASSSPTRDGSISQDRVASAHPPGVTGGTGGGVRRRRAAGDRRRGARGAAQPRRGRAAAAGAGAGRPGRGAGSGDRSRRAGAGGDARERPQARAGRAGAGAAERARPAAGPRRAAGAAHRQQGEGDPPLPRGDRHGDLAHAPRPGEGGEAYRHLARAAAALLGPLRGGQGAPRRDRLRGPADPRRAAAGAGRDRRGLPQPLQPPAGRRVPGHQPPAAAADRGAARAAQRAGRGRRRAAVDLRLPPRRPRRLPPPARADRRARRRRADGAERQLPLAPGADRRRQPVRRGAAGRDLPAAAGRATPADGRQVEPGRRPAHDRARSSCC